jgi:phosphoglucomutase
MKSSPDISWNEKGELKYKGETVQGSNVVDLVNDVLSKRQYFNPQGWETFGEALREANVAQDLIGHEDAGDASLRPKEHRDLTNDNRVHPILDRTPQKTPRNRRKEVQNWVDF